MTNVKQVNKLHNKAMIQCDFALMQRRAGNFPAALLHLEQAFKHESQAAAIMANTAIEPTRSVIHRSAATLAFDIHNIAEAERLITVAHEGIPPKEIEIELNELTERIEQFKNRPAQLAITEAKQILSDIESEKDATK